MSSTTPATQPTGQPAPVTVSITRQVEPEHADQMIAWVRAGFTLAERFPGFLGAGWVRPGTRSSEWHCLYRFDSPASLDAWEASPQRQWWLSSGRGLVGEVRKELRTGIEGWFDEPRERDVADLRALPPAPPRWKQAVMIWTAFFPLSLVVNIAIGAVLPDLPVLPRVLLMTLVLTPIMTYVVLPRLTRALDWWLHGRPAPWRRSD